MAPTDTSWREFEMLVSRLEEALSPRGAVVLSPDRLPDKVTGEMREVDASIRYRVGSAEILIIVECRERKRVQDSIWIEQLCAKQRDVGAAKCIAVTTAGFSKSAARKAKAHGIELRHVKRAALEDVAAWAPTQTFFYRHSMDRVSLTLVRPGTTDLPGPQEDLRINRELLNKNGLDGRFIKSKDGKQKISVYDLFAEVFNYSYSEKSGEFPNIELEKPMIVSFAGEAMYEVTCSLGNFDVLGLAAETTFHWFVDYEWEAKGSFRYADPDRDLVQAVELTFAQKGGGTGRLEMYRPLVPELGAPIVRWTKHGKN